MALCIAEAEREEAAELAEQILKDQEAAADAAEKESTTNFVESSPF